MHDELQAQINKRLTLNLMIQGAASHTFLTSHHLVKHELDSIDPNLCSLYDKISVAVYLAQWYSDFVLVMGTSKRFWRRVHKPSHPFCKHPLLSRHGPALALAAKRHAISRAKEKGVSSMPGAHYVHTIRLLLQTFRAERENLSRLTNLACRSTALIWGIDERRLNGQITGSVEFGKIRTPQSFGGRILRSSAAGYGGVVRDGKRFVVMGKAWMWPLLSHELVKGTAELVCLHGLNKLNRSTYDKVIENTDHIEYEIWMMQAGSELWRRLLSCLPNNRPLAHCIMHLARLDPDHLDLVMNSVVETPRLARKQIDDLPFDCLSDETG